MGDSFVPPSFEVPQGYAWSEFHLEPLAEQHNDRDHAAWMSSIDHIRSTPGFSPQEEPNWPVAMRCVGEGCFQPVAASDLEPVDERMVSRLCCDSVQGD